VSAHSPDYDVGLQLAREPNDLSVGLAGPHGQDYIARFVFIVRAAFAQPFVAFSMSLCA
jgi:hypothetical protein